MPARPTLLAMGLASLTTIPDTPDLAALSVVADPVERAAAADDLVWLAPRGYYRAAGTSGGSR